MTGMSISYAMFKDRVFTFSVAVYQERFKVRILEAGKPDIAFTNAARRLSCWRSR
jgi:hypothetical protein